MAAWGAKPFDNDLARDYLSVIVIENIHSILAEEFINLDRLDASVKHKLAYRYDRLRAAVELMLTFETNGWYAFAPGYYLLAWDKMQTILNDKDWRDRWDDANHFRSYNYMEDCRRQSSALDRFYNLKIRDLSK